jgi:hypothetical protein
VATTSGPPDVFVHPQGAHPGQPVGRVQTMPCFGFDRVPQGVPVHPQMAGQRRDGGVVVGQRVGGPADRPGGQLGPRRDQRMLLGEGHHRAGRLTATPHPLAPHHHGRGRETRRVGHPMASSAMPASDHPAARAAGHRLVALHGQHQPPVLVAGDVQHVQAGHVEQGIGTRAPTHARTARTVIHVGAFISIRSLVATDLEGPDPSLRQRHAADNPLPMLRSEDPH